MSCLELDEHVSDVIPISYQQHMYEAVFALINMVYTDYKYTNIIMMCLELIKLYISETLVHCRTKRKPLQSDLDGTCKY